MPVAHCCKRARQQRVQQTLICLHRSPVSQARCADFNKGSERELLSSSADDQRCISPLEVAFNFAAVPWPLPTSRHCGASPKSSTAMWPKCCKFVKWPDTSHSPFDVVPASIGLQATDQTWHYEQWMHLNFAGRQEQRDASPSDSKSRRHGYQIPTMFWVTGVAPTGVYRRCIAVAGQLSLLPSGSTQGSVAQFLSTPSACSSDPCAVRSILPVACPRLLRGLPAAAPRAAPFDQFPFPPPPGGGQDALSTFYTCLELRGAVAPIICFCVCCSFFDLT